MAKFRLSQILHLCTQKSVCATHFRPFGKIGANFPVQLSSRLHFANIKKKKKVIAENQCEKHKKLEFSLVCIALNVRNGTESKYPPVVFRVYFIDTDEGLARDWALALPLFLNKFAADDKWLVEYEKK